MNEDIKVSNEDLSLGGRIESSNALDGRRLPGSVGAEQPIALAWGDIKRDIGDRLDIWAGALVVALREMNNAERCRGKSSSLLN